MKFFFVLLFAMFSTELHAAYKDNIDPVVVSYAAKLLQEDAQAIDIQIKKYPVKTGDFLFGVVYNFNAASIFIIEQSNGTIREISKTAPFTFSADRSSFEGIEITSASKFSVSLSYRGVCGGGSETYIFVERNRTWKVAGRDMRNYECAEPENNGDGNDSIGDNINEISINYLSGDKIKTVFRHGATVSKTKSKEKYPSYPLGSVQIDELPD